MKYTDWINLTASKDFTIKATTEYLNRSGQATIALASILSGFDSVVGDKAVDLFDDEDAIIDIDQLAQDYISGTEVQSIQLPEGFMNKPVQTPLGFQDILNLLKTEAVLFINKIIDNDNDTFQQWTDSHVVCNIQASKLLNNVIQPLSDITTSELATLFSGDVNLMDEVKKASASFFGMSSALQCYSPKDETSAESKFTLQVSEFYSNLDANAGGAIEQEWKQPAISMLEIAKKCSTPHDFISVVMEMLGGTLEQLAVPNEFDAYNNDMYQYTGSAWAGFVSLTEGINFPDLSQLFNSVGNVIFNIYAQLLFLPFTILTVATDAIIKWINGLINPVAWDVYAGDSPTVPNMARISRNVTFQLRDLETRNGWIPLQTEYFGPSSGGNHVSILYNEERLNNIKNKWVRIEAFGFKAAYRLTNWTTTTINGLIYLKNVTIDAIAKPVAYDINTCNVFLSCFRSEFNQYNVVDFSAMTVDKWSSLKTAISQSNIKNIEAQSAGYNINTCGAVCLAYPYYWAIMMAMSYIRTGMKFDSTGATTWNNRFGSGTWYNTPNVGAGHWMSSMESISPRELFNSARSIDNGSTNISNVELTSLACGYPNNWMGLYLPDITISNAKRQYINVIYNLAQYPQIMFMAWLKDFTKYGDTPSYYVDKSLEWGTEQFNIKTDAAMATDNLIKIGSALAAVVTVVGVAVAPKIIRKYNTNRLAKSNNWIKVAKNKMDANIPLNRRERRKVARANNYVWNMTHGKSASIISQTGSFASMAEKMEKDTDFSEITSIIK